MNKFLSVMGWGAAVFFLLTGCQTPGTAETPARLPRLPASTHTAVATLAATGTPLPSQTPVSQAALSASPGVTFPAPLPFHGTLPAGVDARFGLGGFGAVALSPDGSYLAVTSGVGILLYQPETLSQVGVLPGVVTLGPLDWSPDGQQLAVVTDVNTVTIWNVAAAKPVQTLTVAGVNCLGWSPDGEKLALATDERVVEIWDLKASRKLSLFAGHTATSDLWQKIFKLQWVSDQKIVSIDENGYTLLWEPGSGRLLHTWEKTESSFTRGMALSPDGTTLAIAGPQEKEISLWDLASLREIKTLTGLAPFLQGMAWSPDGQRLALAALFPSEVLSVEVSSGSIQSEFLTHLPNVSGPLWLKDGRSLITKNGAGAGDVLTVWDLQSGQVRQSLRGMAANLTVWSPDGQTIAASDGKTITLWDVGSGNPRLLLGEIQDGPLAGGSNAEGIFRMAFNPDGTLLAAESGNKRSRIRVWDTRTGQLFGKIWSGKPLEKLSWRSATQLAVWVSSAGVEIWEPASGASQPWFDSALHHAQLDLSADGALAAVHQENRLEIRKLPDGEILHTWEVGMKSLGLVWSPDASKIALFDAEKITIYAVSTGAELGSLKNNLSGLSALQWSPDSASLAYLIWLPGGTPGCPISGTGALYLWPIAAAGSTRVSTEMPMPGLNPAGNIAFSPDGKRLALALGQRGLIVIRP